MLCCITPVNQIRRNLQPITRYAKRISVSFLRYYSSRPPANRIDSATSHCCHTIRSITIVGGEEFCSAQSHDQLPPANTKLASPSGTVSLQLIISRQRRTIDLIYTFIRYRLRKPSRATLWRPKTTMIMIRRHATNLTPRPVEAREEEIPDLQRKAGD
jgi:hypothetical protein